MSFSHEVTGLSICSQAMLSCDRFNTLTYFPHACLTNTKTPPLLRPCWLSFTAGLENCRKSGKQSSGSLRSRNVSVKNHSHIAQMFASHTLPSSPSTFQFRMRKGMPVALARGPENSCATPHARPTRSHMVLSVCCRHCPPSQTVVLVVNAVYLRSRITCYINNTVNLQ